MHAAAFIGYFMYVCCMEFSRLVYNIMLSAKTSLIQGRKFKDVPRKIQRDPGES